MYSLAVCVVLQFQVEQLIRKIEEEKKNAATADICQIPFFFLSKSLFVGWTNSYLGGNFFIKGPFSVTIYNLLLTGFGN